MPDIRFELDPQLDPILDRLIGIWVDVSNAGGSVGFVPPVTRTDVEPVAAEAFGGVTAGHTHLVVAFESDEAIGFAFMDARPGPLFRHWLTVKRLQVKPDLQGRGHGRALLEACEDFARDMDVEYIHLTARGKTGTEAFYTSTGYEVVARIPGVIRVAPGDDRDEIYMIKRL